MLRDVLPRGTELLACQAGLHRSVTWAAALRLREGFGEIEPGAMALLTVETLNLLPTRPTVAKSVEALGRIGVAAVAIRGEVPTYQMPMTAFFADRAGCAVLQLPHGNGLSITRLEEEVNAYLTARRSTWTHLSGQVSQPRTAHAS